jgi:hypothetical protein
MKVAGVIRHPASARIGRGDNAINASTQAAQALDQNGQPERVTNERDEQKMPPLYRPDLTRLSRLSFKSKFQVSVIARLVHSVVK